MGNQEEVTVYDETIRRVAEELDLTPEYVDEVMTLYNQKSREVHLERGHFKPGLRLASSTRSVVE